MVLPAICSNVLRCVEETVFPQCVQDCSHSDSMSCGWDRTRMMEVEPALQADARWQLIERITASPPFQKSARLRELLCYLAERTLLGQTQDLSEHDIGSAVFGKAQDYSVVEDSSVRVHVRQLRLKLHEYFDGEGRGESVIVEIPKGAYTTLFRTVEQRTSGKASASCPWIQIPAELAAMVSGCALSCHHPCGVVSATGSFNAASAAMASSCALRFEQPAQFR